MRSFLRVGAAVCSGLLASGASALNVRVLATSRFVSGLLERAPSAAALVGDKDALVPLGRDAIMTAELAQTLQVPGVVPGVDGFNQPPASERSPR